ncbi:SPT6 [Sanghuangporus sanghuang]
MSYADDDMNLDEHVPHEEEMKIQPDVNGVAKGDDAEGGGGENEEGEGEEIEQGKAISDDSSEEEEEDEEAVRRVREGFIVDEDEDEEEEEEEDEEERRRRKKRRKHKHKHKHRKRDEDEEEDLDEEDLELLEENTGGRIRSRHLTRLRRGRDSDEGEEGSSSRRKAIIESSDDDLDEANVIGAQEILDIQDIWNDERAGRDDDDEMDMDDFIDDEEDEEEGAGAMAEEEREERRRERRRLEKERRAALRNRPELTGIDASTWDEIHDVFGDGHDYDWALVDDEEETMAYEVKSEMKYNDVFEPSEIRSKFLTDDDDLIRAQDIPERMQLHGSSLSLNANLADIEQFTPAECVDAASWVTPRLGAQKEQDFFKASGRFYFLLDKLVGAVTKALEFLFIQHLEVPYIYAHRRDHISYFNPHDQRATRAALLSQNDLWRIYYLGQKFHSLFQRKTALQSVYEKLALRDEYFEQQLLPSMDDVEIVADSAQWIGTKYKDIQKKILSGLRYREDEDQADVKKHKLPSRLTGYEVLKKSIASRIAEGFGIKPQEVVINFLSKGHNVHFVEDQELSPTAFAEQYADPDPSKALPADDLLRQARMILAFELGIDPLLRRHTRNVFKNFAQVSVTPTESGKTAITADFSEYSFKYLHNKPVTEMLRSRQFLQILQAEEKQKMVIVTLAIPSDERQKLVNQLVEAFASDSFSEMAKVWNEERALVVEEAVEKYLLPMGAKWVREYLREEVEDFLANHCGDALYERVNVAPYCAPGLQPGDTPAVLAVSWGKGDPKRDEVNLVFLDEAGRLREHAQIDNLQDSKNKEEFRDFLKRRRPDVVVVGGFSMRTADLSHQIKLTLRPHELDYYRPADSIAAEDLSQDDPAFNIPVIYCFDEVARLYQHSKRGEDEFPELLILQRYCVGLARYVQSPLNEYAALGRDVVAITFDTRSQPLVPPERLLKVFERVLVDVVNRVGVDINRAVNDPYYAALLPFVSGLGPRKAQALIKKITSLGGNLVNRGQLVQSQVLTTCIFLNAAGFLRIAQDPDYKEPKSRSGGNVDYSNYPDPLDDTRIHVEDYDLARKMATDALELDEEDVHDEHPSNVVSQIMKDPDNKRKLDELNLDEFAVSMEQTSRELKRITLDVIRTELLRPFGEVRPTFALPTSLQVLTMLSGENEDSWKVGCIVTVQVYRVQDNFANVRLASGIEGIINSAYIADEGDSIPQKGTHINGVIIEVKADTIKDIFQVELSARQSHISIGDVHLRQIQPDEYWNAAQAERDLDFMQRKRRAQTNRHRRVIKHPNFQNFNSVQAEAYLEDQQPGDVVIRPSSKGPNHLAVTWKVADKLYQHIDVTELNPDPSGQALGSQLLVDGKYEFADLDELIVNHVKAMSRRVEELMAHEKYKRDEDELNKFLMSFVAANPNKSIYGFTLNRKKPGHFNLSFLPKKGSAIQTWPVRVAPEAYYLFDAAAAGVSELCNAFKVRYLHESQSAGAAAAGSKTPYGAGRMTPGRPSGLATPGRASIRQPAQTPNPYSSSMPPPGPAMAPSVPGSSYGGSSAYSAAPSGFGFQTPRPGSFPGQQPPAPGMNPPRPAMVQNTGASGSSGGWGSAGWN